MKPKTKHITIPIPKEFAEHTAVQYACDLLDGKVVAGKITKAAAKRFFNDVNQADENGLVFDFAKANRIINFFPTCLRHTIGAKAGEPFYLEPFQQFFLFNVFGWYTKDGKRRFDEAYLKIAKKNGKTAFAAGIEIYCTGFENEQGGQIYSAATKEEQAKIVWKQARDFIDTSPNLKQFGFQINKTKIEFPATNSEIKALGRDSNTQDGINAYVSVIDEYHAHPNDDVRNNLKSSMGARKNPLEIIITTAGKFGHGKCKEYEDVCRLIVTRKIPNESVFVLIFALDKNDDWQDQKVWQKANPGLGSIVYLDRLQRLYQKALTQSSFAKEFQTKNMNRWVSSFGDEWLAEKVIERGAAKPNTNQIKRKCFVGSDLATVTDLTSLAFFSEPDENGIHHVNWKFFMPKEGIEEKADKLKVPLIRWADEGYITLTNGAYTDYDEVRNFVNIKRDEGFNIQWFGTDPWNATQLMNGLDADGFEVEEFSQAIGTISQPTKDVEKLFKAGKIHHGNNPVVLWMLGNVVMYYDANNNQKIHKGKSKAQVDGVISLVVAYGGYLKYITENPGPDYSSGIYFV